MNKITYCKSCFGEIKQNSFKNIFEKNILLCDKCYEKLEVTFRRFSLEGIKGFVLFTYNDFFREKLFILKGCFDIEMAPIFLDKIKGILKIFYKGYQIIPAPSYKEADDLRGFKHLNEIFKSLDLPIIDFFKKNKNVKQSDLNFEERKNIKNVIEKNSSINLSGRKILFVDDVYTSGATAKTCLNILKKENPLKLKFMILSSKFNQEI